MYHKVVGELENYVRNKIRSEKDGTMYLRVNNQLTFNGDSKQYRDHFVQNLNKQLSVFRKIICALKKATQISIIRYIKKVIIITLIVWF